MDAPADDLTPKQLRALEALLAGQSIRRAAEQARVNEKSIRRWMTTAVFRKALVAGRRALFDQALGRLLLLADNAVLAVHDAMRDGRHGDRLKGAKLVFDAGHRHLELQDVEERLAQLEAVQSKGKR